MLFQRLNRTDPEKIYAVYKNVEGATITTGYPVSVRNTSTDGISVVIANATADYPGFVGVAKQDIANNDYGLATIWGYVDSVLVSSAGTSISITLNDALIPAPVGFYSGVPTYLNAGFKWVIAKDVPAAVSAAGYASGVIRML